MSRRPDPAIERERQAILVVLAGAGDGGLTIRELSRRLRLPMVRATNRVKELQRRGWVSEHPQGRMQRQDDGRWLKRWVRRDIDGRSANA